VDQKTAEAVCASLEKAGVPCWIAPRNILAGEDWASSIVEALESCEVIVLVFSDQVNSSPHVSREVNYAERRGAQLAILRVDEAELGGPFRLFELEFAQALPSDSAIEDRLLQLQQRVQNFLGGAAPDSTRSTWRPAMRENAVPPKAFSRLFHLGMLAVVFVTGIRVFLSAVALSEHWTDGIDADEARTYLMVSFPLQAATEFALVALIVVWFCFACSRFAVQSPERVLDAFLSVPGNIVAPVRLVRDLYLSAVPNADLGAASWWWPLTVTAMTLTIAMPIISGFSDDMADAHLRYRHHNSVGCQRLALSGFSKSCRSCDARLKHCHVVRCARKFRGYRPAMG
jgi:hypothetical protein